MYPVRTSRRRSLISSRTAHRATSRCRSAFSASRTDVRRPPSPSPSPTPALSAPAVASRSSRTGGRDGAASAAAANAPPAAAASSRYADRHGRAGEVPGRHPLLLPSGGLVHQRSLGEANERTGRREERDQRHQQRGRRVSGGDRRQGGHYHHSPG